MNLADRYWATVRAQGEPELRAALKRFRPLLVELGDAAKGEAEAWLSAALAAAEAEGEGDYAARRRAMREATAEAEEEAARVEERDRILGAILAQLGELGVVALKVLVAGLVAA